MSKLFVLFVILIASLYTDNSQAKASPRNQLVTIRILEQGLPVAFVHGIYISKSGEIVAPAQLLTPILDPGHSVDIEDSAGKHASKVEVMACGDLQSANVCYFKTDLKPKQWYQLRPRTVAKHEKMKVRSLSEDHFTFIKNTNASFGSLDLSISETIELATIQASLPAGLPLIDAKNNFVGFTTLPIDPQIARPFAISVNDILRVVNKKLKPIALLDWKKERAAELKNASAALFKSRLEPQYEKLVKSEPLDSEHFYYLESTVLGRTFKTALPKVFSQCQSSSLENTATTTCIGDNGAEVFSVSYFKLEPESLKKLDGSQPSAEPLQVTQHLQSTQNWQSLAATLTEKQKKSFYSSPGKISCRESTDDSEPPILKKSVNCRASVYNEIFSGASSFTQIAQDKQTGHVVKISVWIANSNTADFFFHLPTLSLLSTTFSDTEKIRSPAASKEEAKTN